MDEFEKELKSFCCRENGPYLRPFAPNPRWQTASVIIIGTNPATPLRHQFDSFDDYWAGLTQQPQIFWEKYRAEHGSGTTKTTENMLRLRAQLETNCLVTNVSWFPATKFDRKVQIQKGAQDAFAPLPESSKMLKKLIGFCPAKVLFFHGRRAREFALQAYGIALDCYAPPQEQTTRTDGILLLAYHHLSGLGLRKGARFQPCIDLPEFAKRIREELDGHA